MMGHCTCHDVFPMNLSKDEIFYQVNEVAIRESDHEGGNGLPCGIRWYDQEIQNSRKEAEVFIDKHDKGFYDQLAVPFRQVNEDKLTNQKTIELKQKISELEKNYQQKNNNIHYKGVKSKTVTCKKCSSKLATAYLYANHCPLCLEELRPESVLKDLENKKTKIEQLKQKLKEEEKRLNDKNIKNSTLMWLVKTEFHV